MAELYTLQPLFPGRSEIDQIFRVTSILGTPNKVRFGRAMMALGLAVTDLSLLPLFTLQNDWPEAYQLANGMNFRFPQFSHIPVETVVTNLSPEGLQILKDMLQWNPAKRPTAAQSLKYDYFRNVQFVPQQ